MMASSRSFATEGVFLQPPPNQGGLTPSMRLQPIVGGRRGTVDAFVLQWGFNPYDVNPARDVPKTMSPLVTVKILGITAGAAEDPRRSLALTLPNLAEIDYSTRQRVVNVSCPADFVGYRYAMCPGNLSGSW